LLWESGWENVILQPEMQHKEIREDFLKLVDRVKGQMQSFAKNREENNVEVFVGKENPMIKSDEFSMITCKSSFPNTKNGCVFVLLGPKRMPYKENIDLFEDLLKYLQNI
jgi:transcriptional regulator of heat shock response